jgi:hypothetical protein
MTTIAERPAWAERAESPFDPAAHVPAGRSTWGDRMICSCGAIVLADHAERAWVSPDGSHYLPFPASRASGRLAPRAEDAEDHSAPIARPGASMGGTRDADDESYADARERREWEEAKARQDAIDDQSRENMRAERRAAQAARAPFRNAKSGTHSHSQKSRSPEARHAEYVRARERGIRQHAAPQGVTPPPSPRQERMLSRGLAAIDRRLRSV